MAAERFGDALTTARSQDARFWQLRAAIGLVRADGAEINARKQLAEIFSSFTEGSTLPDMKAAQLLAATVGSA